MTKVMSSVFMSFGVLIMLASFGVISLGLVAFLIVLVLGGAVFCLGLSIKKLLEIENNLGKFSLIPNTQKEPLIRCEKCNRLYHLDVTECPYCKLTELNNKVNDLNNYIKYSKKD